MQYLYLIRCQEYYKIGVANDVESRLAQLSTGNPFPLEVRAVFGYENASAVETVLHQRFARRRERGEWFRLDTSDYANLIEICSMLEGYVPESDLPVVEENEIQEAEQIDVSLENVRTELRMFNGEPRGVVLFERGAEKKIVAYIGKTSEEFDKYLELYKQEHPKSRVLCGTLSEGQNQ